jgi:bacteriocin biosynthesis cyclodehydratase domain-containing protein
VDGPASAAHRAHVHPIDVSGDGAWCDRLKQHATSDAGGPRLRILCQTTLNYLAPLDANRQARRAGEFFIWVSSGALDRAYVSPLFLPNAGPCFACLLRTFQRLSPAPEIYDALIEHGRAAGAFASFELPADAADVLHGLVLWKLAQAALEQPAGGLYRLHVLERASMEVSTHRVFADAECPECREGRR